MTHSTSVEYKSRSKCLTCSLSAERKPWNSKIQLKGLSDLCPVTVLICLASMLCSESTVTDVARTQWLVRWGAIPADVDMFFIMFSSVVLPTGELQYHSSSFCGWNFVDTSLGHWNKACRLGFRSLRELSRVFTGQRFELETSNVFGRLSHRLSTMVCCSEAVLIIGRWLAGSL